MGAAHTRPRLGADARPHACKCPGHGAILFRWAWLETYMFFPPVFAGTETESWTIWVPGGGGQGLSVIFLLKKKTGHGNIAPSSAGCAAVSQS